MSGRLARERTEKYLRALRLWDRRDDIARSLSGGMKRRLMIARALVHEPRLLILDEPTAGVDIEIRRSMWAFLRDINAAGTTIILTTHYLEEAESLCRHVAIIDEGEIIEDAPMSRVLRKPQREVFVLSLAEEAERAPQLDGFRTELVDSGELEVEMGKRRDAARSDETQRLTTRNFVSDRHRHAPTLHVPVASDDAIFMLDGHVVGSHGEPIAINTNFARIEMAAIVLAVVGVDDDAVSRRDDLGRAIVHGLEAASECEVASSVLVVAVGNRSSHVVRANSLTDARLLHHGIVIHSDKPIDAISFLNWKCQSERFFANVVAAGSEEQQCNAKSHEAKLSRRVTDR